MKASGFFDRAGIQSPNIVKFLTSNDVNEFDVEGIDSKLKDLVEYHKKL